MSRREFHFVEGTSSKFWAVSVSDTTMTIQFGKIGTTGQTQVKTFASPTAAMAAAEKLITEKTGKGYTEVGGSVEPAGTATYNPAPTKAAPAEHQSGGPVRRIHLPPEMLDPPPIAPRPPLVPERPFDLAALKARVKATHNSGHDALDAPASVTPEEARFWLRCCSTLQKPEKATELIPLDDLKAAFQYLQFAFTVERIFKLQFAWVDPADLVELAAHAPFVNVGGVNAWYLVPWLRSEVWPRCDAAAMERVRKRLRKMLKGRDARAACVAAVLARDAGIGPDVLAFVEKLDRDSLPKWFENENWHTVLLSLDDPGETVKHYRRLGLHVDRETARDYIARTKFAGLDVLADSIPHAYSADMQAKMLSESLLLVEAPEAAPALLSLKLKAKPAKIVARIVQWLDKHPEPAVAGLTPLEGEKAPLGKAAREWLEAYRKRTAAPTPTPAPSHATSPAPAPVAVVAPPAPKRRLALSPADERQARGPQAAPPLPPLRPFDLSALKTRAIDFIHRNEVPFDPAHPVTPQEARFWLVVHSLFSSYTTDDREKEIKKFNLRLLDRFRTLDDVKAAVENLHYWNINVPTMLLQRSWLPPADLVEATACNQMVRLNSQEAAQAASWLEDHFYPHLDTAAMDAVRGRLRHLIATSGHEVALAAAVLGRHAGLEADLEKWATGLKKGGIPPASVNAGFAAALFGIKDAAVLVTQFRRLGLRLASPADARIWLALTGHDGLDIVRDSIFGQRKAADQLAMLDVLLLAESPEAAVALLEARLQAKPPEAVARIDAWMKAHPGHAASGLTPLTAENSPRGEAARTLLGASPASAAPASADWLREGLALVKPAKTLPTFADPALLPPIHGLGADDLSRILAALRDSTLAGAHPLVSALRRHGDRPALAAFAWSLFEGWLKAGAPSKEKWALLALGHLGDDGVVQKVTPMIRAWPGESQHQRAVTGLEILRSIGSDAALMALNGMALKLKFKALQDRARQLMDLIAADRGLTRDQLEDRIVPDLGLDGDGQRFLDFGPRRFRLTLSDDLSPVLADDGGKELKDLPKPGGKDDPALAAEAAAAWKLFKSQLRDAIKVQSFRLEEAMVTGRSWPLEEFKTLLVAHPFLTRLVRQLVWDGGEGQLFRVGDGGEFVSHDGRKVRGFTSVRVAHRLRMTGGQIGSWRGALDDLDIEPPFPQLERTVFAPEPGEVNAPAFARPVGAFPAAKVRGNLEGRGWRRLMHDQGGITGFSKAFASTGVTGVVMLTGTIVIGMMSEEDVGIEEAFFVAGVDHPHGPCSDEFHERMARIRLGEVDPVAFSETMRDLLSVAPPGKV